VSQPGVEAVRNSLCPLHAADPRWRVSLQMSTTVALLVIIHLFETFLWTVPIWRFG
jgi:hypothetical protein